MFIIKHLETSRHAAYRKSNVDAILFTLFANNPSTYPMNKMPK